MVQKHYINSVRLKTMLADFAQIGKTKNNGVTRLALTELDKQARDLLVKIGKDAGFSVSVDRIGNIYIRRLGLQPELPIVLTGSHGDSQPRGGRYDGIYGVLAGLEVLLSLNDNKIQTQRSIELVCWTNEEGSRFAPAMLGSAVFIKKLSIEKALKIKDYQGISVEKSLKQIGYNGDYEPNNKNIHASVEIHIEQGPILENNNNLIGLVKGALGHRWYEIEFTGLASHAGTTPMNFRQDAILGLGKAITELNKLAKNLNDDGIRLTVGMIHVSPNSRNVIADKAWFTIDMRHPNQAVLDNMDISIKQLINKIANNFNLTVVVNPVLSMPPLSFNEKLINIIREVCIDLDYPSEEIMSGAGHDSCNLVQIAPTAMIFIPCINGLSHNENENITQQWMEAGANVLYETMIRCSIVD